MVRRGPRGLPRLAKSSVVEDDVLWVAMPNCGDEVVDVKAVMCVRDDAARNKAPSGKDLLSVIL